MRAISTFTQVYLSRDPRDFRKWVNGLVAIVEGEMKLDLSGNYLFAFTNKRRDKIKCLYFDRTGYAIWFKQLEAQRFAWPRKGHDEVVTLTPQQLEWLLDGFDITRMRPHLPLRFASNF